ncbi:MAG: ABC transporter ATP-binding protein [Thermodesulfovibrio sp.]|nr:ABC transporter ATP-binding protein [Thermodesulfovibrio sp.]
MASEVILQVINVSKSFGGLRVLNNVNLSVKKGNIHALIGPNGAGKTTLLNIISGLEKSDNGEIVFKGKSLRRLSSYKRARIGITRTFQNLELFSDMTVIENVMAGMYFKRESGFIASGLKLRKVRKDEKDIANRSLQILDFFELSHKKDEIAKNLPIGEQRLVELARAIASEPELILLDEPAAGLNIKETKTLGILIQKIRQDMGITVLLIDHDMELVMKICDFITVLNFGEVIAEGEPIVIQKDPKVITAYLGEEF